MRDTQTTHLLLGMVYFVIKDLAIVKQLEVLTDSLSIFFNPIQIHQLVRRLWLSQAMHTLANIDLYGVDLYGGCKSNL